MSGRLIETSVWVSLLRSRTPRPLRQRLAYLATGDDALICEPVFFELDASQTHRDWPAGWRILEITPMLTTPATLWKDAAPIGKGLQERGVLVPALDLLIAQIAIHHGATLVTMDRHFLEIRKASPLAVEFVDTASGEPDA